MADSRDKTFIACIGKKLLIAILETITLLQQNNLSIRVEYFGFDLGKSGFEFQTRTSVLLPIRLLYFRKAISQHIIREHFKLWRTGLDCTPFSLEFRFLNLFSVDKAAVL
jgi:hypothetical protein